MRSTKIGAVVLAGLLSVTLAACGDDDETSTDSGASAEATPAAAIPSLTGVSTAVKLDSGFTDALTALKVTPGVVGTAKLTDGSLVFPITGGNVTYFTPGQPNTPNPYVTGEIDHNGSGLSLTAGGTKVELTDFVVNPGTSILTGKVTANGEVAAESANLFFLDGRTLQPLSMSGSNAVLTGTQVKIHPDAAKLLNDTYMLTGTANAIPDFFTVGVATITVAVPAS